MVRFGVEGTADVFEDVPSILVVIVAAFLFLMVMAESVISYSRFQEERFLSGEMESFCESILSFNPLLFRSTYGQLDSQKLTISTTDQFQEQFNPEILGFHYNITLLDVGIYEKKYSWHVGEERDNAAISRMASVPAVVRNELDRYHPMILNVSIWR